MPAATHLEIIALGGLGEFGMNLTVFRHGSDCIVVDAGMMFPGAEHLGVDVVIPDISFLKLCGTLHGVILTHGHEDHIGALPYLLAEHDLPVYSSDYTRGLIEARLSEHARLPRPTLRPLPGQGERLKLGPFEVECLHAAHSIPQARMLAIRTPLGLIVHTADFKLDPHPPDGCGTDLTRLAELGGEGVLALLSDSTNADRPGVTPAERSVGKALDRILERARGRVFVATFASNIQRIAELGRLARRHGRKLALVGSSIKNHVGVARGLDLLRFPAGVEAELSRVMNLPRERALLAVSGTQGEPMSALSRIAVDTHREARVDPGDLVLHSARKIPGNEKSIGRLINHLLHRGAEVITSDEAPIHVSGHAAQEELRLLLQLVRPSFFVPVHGEYRQLHSHARLAVDLGLPEESVLLAESGELIAIGPGAIEVVDRVRVGQRLIDDTRDHVDWTVLRDRQRAAADGIVVVVVSAGALDVDPAESPEIVTRGFAPDRDGSDSGLIDEAKRRVVATLADLGREERGDETLLKARIQSELKRFLRHRTQRQPLIVPVIVGL